MNEDFVTYEQAIKLKELGFGWKCDYIYINKKICPTFLLSYNWVERNNCFPASTLAQAQKWLRENNIYVYAELGNEHKFFFYIENSDCDQLAWSDCPPPYITYEEALSAGIDKAFKILTKQ